MLAKSVGFVFCHGWGFDPSYFDGLKARLDGFEFIDWDLGYFSPAEHCLSNLHSRVRWFGVGHSLGFAKLLSSKMELAGLFGMQGFVDFITDIPGFAETRKLQWASMCKRFRSHPERELARFHQLCGRGIGEDINAEPLLQLNPHKLLSDLERLPDKIILSDLPISVIAKDRDPVIPLPVVKHNFCFQAHKATELRGNSAGTCCIDLNIIPGRYHAVDDPVLISKRLLDFVCKVEQA